MSQRNDDTTFGGDDLHENDRRRVVSRGTTDYRHDNNDIVEVKNRVQFGPIVAGVLTAIGTLLILTVLGLAIGASALEPREVGEGLGFGAAIWGIVSALIAFFLGGWVAAKTAAVAGAGSGMINGLMVGFAILAIVLWLTGSGVSAVVGTLGSNIGELTGIAQSEGTTTEEAQAEAEAQVDETLEDIDPASAFDTARDAAWGTLAGMVVPLGAAALGGVVGHNKREDVIQTGPPAHQD